MTAAQAGNGMDEARTRELIEHLENSYTFYQEFLELELRKYDALSQNRLEGIDELVRSEEASLLKVKGLERRREQILAGMGMAGRTMSEVIDAMDGPVKQKASELFMHFTQLLLDLKEVNLRCEGMAELRLRRTETLRKQLESQPELQQMYTQQAQQVREGGSVLSKTI